MSDSLWSHGLYPSKLLRQWGFSKQEYWSELPYPPVGHLPNLGIKPRSPTLQWLLYHLSELPGKPKNTGIVRLSLLQGIFMTHELNQGLLHCRQIFTSWAITEAQIFNTCSLNKKTFFHFPEFFPKRKKKKRKMWGVGTQPRWGESLWLTGHDPMLLDKSLHGRSEKGSKN